MSTASSTDYVVVNATSSDLAIDNENTQDYSDPLNIKPLALEFDSLLKDINKKTESIAVQVLNHVDEMKKNSDSKLCKINENLEILNSLILKCNNINLEIDKLEQLHSFTIDFSLRLNEIQKKLDMNK